MGAKLDLMKASLRRGPQAVPVQETGPCTEYLTRELALLLKGAKLSSPLQVLLGQFTTTLNETTSRKILEQLSDIGQKSAAELARIDGFAKSNSGV